MTKGQLAMKDACLDAIRARTLKIIEAPHGVGLEHCVRNLIKYSPYIKTVHVDCMRKRSSRYVFVSLLRDAMNVRFSNLNYLSVDLHRLLMVVRERMDADLRKENLLIVIDHIDVLRANQLEYLPKLLEFRKLPCGVIVRTTTSHRLALSKNKNYPDLHDSLYVKLTPGAHTLIAMTTRDERKIFIRDVNGISNEQFINDLSKHRWGFSKMQIFIDRWKAKYRPQ